MNPLVEMTNSTASGAITESGNLMNWEIGYVVYFVIGLSILGTIVAVVKKFF